VATGIQALDFTGVEEPIQAATDGAYEVLQRAAKHRCITPQNIIENVYGFDIRRTQTIIQSDNNMSLMLSFD
jgi:hypothetical protein